MKCRRELSLAIHLLSITLAGCAVGPDYSRPEPGLHDFVHVPPAAQTRQGEAPSLDSWWRAFNDPLLADLIQRGLRQNLDMAAALARVEQARANASAAGANLLPTFAAQADATALHQSAESSLGSLAQAYPGYSRGQREYSAGAVASWEIDLAGGLRRDASAARYELEASEAEGLGVRITVAADIADAYLQIRGLQARVAVANDQVMTDGKLLDLVRARKRAGAAEEREVAQAEALLTQAKALLPILRQALSAQFNRLDVLLGVQPGTYTSALSVPSAIPSIPPIEVSNAPTEVLRRRPDIIAAERRLGASSERIGAAISDYYPKISLSGLLGFDSVNAHQLFTGRAFQAAITGGLRWRLFDFGKVDAEVRAAKGANAEALAKYRQTVLRAAQDVEDAFVSLMEAESYRAELEQEVQALTRARDLSQLAYKAGSITLTDVLDADRQLLTARDGLDASRADVARAAVTAFRSLGGGWTMDGNSEAVQPLAQANN
ncbi:efflux transporter outer membrane subunit [Caballeronia sp. AZ10_KS36]|uniref:efflux transporter outer membrane subunit n=1 Tax=Caballeronia sp. AZ10_KS36 TaxID=2921757 RepID=UPI002028C757|nr:efflux transporter outer membrane subunit [Caballeronia sp. AZ10_KS36]